MRKRSPKRKACCTFLSPEAEDRNLKDRVEADEADVYEVRERPSGQTGELCRDEGSAHCTDAVDGVHDTHFDRRVFAEASDERVGACILSGGETEMDDQTDISECEMRRVPTRNASPQPAKRYPTTNVGNGAPEACRALPIAKMAEAKRKACRRFTPLMLCVRAYLQLQPENRDLRLSPVP